jgi:Ca2+/Na+ antiporter
MPRKLNIDLLFLDSLALILLLFFDFEKFNIWKIGDLLLLRLLLSILS